MTYAEAIREIFDRVRCSHLLVPKNLERLEHGDVTIPDADGIMTAADIIRSVILKPLNARICQHNRLILFALPEDGCPEVGADRDLDWRAAFVKRFVGEEHAP